MRRIFALALLAIAFVATPALAQNFPGPSSPGMARIYFYRLVESNLPTRWTGVFIDDRKVGDLGERQYFFRDVPPGTYKISVTSDVPYEHQYNTVTVAPNSTAFIRVFFVPGYGVQVYPGGLGSPPQIYQPSVFGNRVMNPVRAEEEMTGLAPAGG